MRCAIDSEGRVVFASAALAWLAGMQVEDIVGRPAAEILSVLDLSGGRTLGKDALKAGQAESGRYEMVLNRRDCDPRLVYAQIDKVASSSGQVFNVVSFDELNEKTDIADIDIKELETQIADMSAAANDPLHLKNAEEQISIRDGELRHFLNLSNDLLGVYFRDGRFARVNYAFNRVLGFSDAELKTFPFISLIHPDDKADAERHLSRVASAPRDVETRADFSARSKCKDGEIKWLEWIVKSIGDHIYIVARDITQSKQHEAALRRREQQLDEAQRLARMGHWRWAVNQDKIEWSDQIYRIFGADPESFKPTLENINARLLKRDVGRIYQVFQRALEEKKDYDFEFRLRLLSGEIRYIRCEGSCEVDAESGAIVALFGVMQDITERTMHEKALREAKEAAESAYAAKTRFLANMSHELRTPLNAIIGFSEMMQRQLLGPLGNERYLDYIGGIRESGEHLLDLITDILDMAKIEAGKYDLQLETLNIVKIIGLALHMMEGRAHESQVTLRTENLRDNSVQIVADRRALMQILLNLLSNAVKFTQSGGFVEVSFEKQLGGVAITVSDNGIGIPPEKLSAVTKPFEQVDSELTRKHEGTGLGLAITKDLTELHGGSIEIHSQPGKGTSVTVFFPDRAAITSEKESEAAA